MDDRYEECELGADVTHLFKSDSAKVTVLVSVSLDAEDLARLEKLGKDNGTTVAQVIRDAIAAYQPETEAVSGQR